MKKIVLFLAAGATLMATGPAFAQDPASYPRHSMGSPPSLDPAFRPSRDVRHREHRARIAAGLIRNGRCDAAARLAMRQGDKPMLSRISEVCRTEKASGA
ncbi:MAG: hypothetical protein B7Y81_15220 [Caulobacter sp. 32-67-35]|nr:MAG: hypothetical protein B7Y81_15220 [Caulobacter sp. 32-67-35]OZA71215.1 MAG: hypothetical protein B7X77_13085 [Caulobacter sp. 39-67-4]HQR89329.1 hypothetical protein [Caulobacter sp.]